jgi:tetratricopeptide (TPR) repeat protein
MRNQSVLGALARFAVLTVALSARAADQAQAPAPGAAGHPSAADLFKRISPSVVRIIAIDKNGRPMGQGSGFVATESGLVVTNYHVVKGSATLAVLLEGNKKLEVAGIAAVDPDGDLALVKTTGALPPALTIAAGALPEVGSRTYAIGNPLGLTNTLSEGLVSGLRKENESLTFIQTSAPISPGSSGGPLVDEEGRVLGVTTLCFVAGQNLNFAVQGARIRSLLENYKGELTATATQAWAPTRGERHEASYWLAQAMSETARSRSGQERYCAWIAGAYASIGDRDGCLRSLELWHMSIGNGDASWYQEAAAAAVRAKLGDAAGATAEIEASPNVRTRLYGYVLIGQALAASGDASGYDRYIELAEKLATQQTDPMIRADSLVVITSAHAETGRFDAATRVCGMIVDTEDPMLDANGSKGGYRRNARSTALALIAIARAKVGNFDAARKIAETIFDHTDRAFCMMTIVQRLIEAKRDTEAVALCERISLPVYKARALLAAAGGMIAHGDRAGGRDAITRARVLAKGFGDANIRGRFTCMLVGVLAEGGEFDSAQKVAQSLWSEDDRSIATARIALAYARRGDYAQMMRSLATIRNQLAAIGTYNEIATLQAQAGHMKAACETMSRITIAMARGEAARAIMKAGVGKVSAEQVGKMVAVFRTPEERAAGYLGLAEGMIDQEKKPGTDAALADVKD